jgi:hypothetical protein
MKKAYAKHTSWLEIKARSFYRLPSDCERLIKSTGGTLITPPRGLSKSEIRKNETDTISGSTVSNKFPERDLFVAYPTSRFENAAIKIISPHAETGIRFHHENCA